MGLVLTPALWIAGVSRVRGIPEHSVLSTKVLGSFLLNVWPCFAVTPRRIPKLAADVMHLWDLSSAWPPTLQSAASNVSSK